MNIPDEVKNEDGCTFRRVPGGFEEPAPADFDVVDLTERHVGRYFCAEHKQTWFAVGVIGMPPFFLGELVKHDQDLAWEAIAANSPGFMQKAGAAGNFLPNSGGARFMPRRQYSRFCTIPEGEEVKPPLPRDFFVHIQIPPSFGNFGADGKPFPDAAFVEPPSDFACSICMQVPSDPVKTPCNHSFCSVCLQRWFHQTPSCPLCRRATVEYQFDDERWRAISACPAKCPHEGCETKNLAIRDISAHIYECDLALTYCLRCGELVRATRAAWDQHRNVDCPQLPTRCPHCMKKVLASEFGDHLSIDGKSPCTHLLNCVFCGTALRFNELKDHLLTLDDKYNCKGFGECKHGCGLSTTLAKLQQHLCDLEVVECEHYCGLSTTRSRMQEHVCDLEPLRCEHCEQLFPRRAMAAHTDCMVTCKHCFQPVLRSQLSDVHRMRTDVLPGAHVDATDPLPCAGVVRCAWGCGLYHPDAYVFRDTHAQMCSIKLAAMEAERRRLDAAAAAAAQSAAHGTKRKAAGKAEGRPKRKKAKTER